MTFETQNKHSSRSMESRILPGWLLKLAFFIIFSAIYSKKTCDKVSLFSYNSKMFQEKKIQMNGYRIQKYISS